MQNFLARKRTLISLKNLPTRCSAPRLRVYRVFEFKLNFEKVVPLVPPSPLVSPSPFSPPSPLVPLAPSLWCFSSKNEFWKSNPLVPPPHFLEIGVGSLGGGGECVAILSFVCAFCPPPPTPSALSSPSVSHPLLPKFSLKSNLIFPF